MSTRIRWELVVLGGFLVEVVIFVVALPMALVFGQHALVYVVPPVCLVVTFGFGWWTARKAGSRPLLHGTLSGVVVAVIYLILTIGQTLPLGYTISHFLKVIGGAAGGFAFAQRSRQAAGAEPARVV
jgi:hypothetical protein